MGTKGEIVQEAFDMLAMNGALVQASDDNITRALRKLEIMVPSWTNKGINIGYRLSSGTVSSSDESGIADTNILAVATNLAKLICPMFGIACPPEIRENAKLAYSGLFIPPQTMRNNEAMPRGLGNTRGGRCVNQFETDPEPLDIENDGVLDDLTLNY